MIVNTSNIRFNIVYKGKEIGFDKGERKMLNHLLSEEDEKKLASLYAGLIYIPNPKKTGEENKKGDFDKMKKLFDKSVKKAKKEGMLPPITTKPIEVGPTDDYVEKSTSIMGGADIIVMKEPDVANVKEGRESFSFDEDGWKKMNPPDETDYFKIDKTELKPSEKEDKDENEPPKIKKEAESEPFLSEEKEEKKTAKGKGRPKKKK